MSHEEAGNTKTSLGCEKQTRDSAGFPLARLSKPSTVLISSASKEEEGTPFSCCFSHGRSPPCPGFYFCICSGSAKPILTAEEGGLICCTCLRLGKAVVTLPVARGKEIGLNTSLLLSELSLNALVLVPMRFLHQILTWFLHCCAVAM